MPRGLHGLDSNILTKKVSRMRIVSETTLGAPLQKLAEPRADPPNQAGDEDAKQIRESQRL